MNTLNMEFLASAAALVARFFLSLALFPFTHVVFPIIRLFYGLLSHLLLIPVLLILRTFIYGFIYIPLVPVLKVADIHYDTLVPVETTLYRLAVGSVPHLHVFVYHFIHYFMMCLFVGSFVGVIAGFNISLVSRILYIEKTNKDESIKRSSNFSASSSNWKRVKREPHILSISTGDSFKSGATTRGDTGQTTEDLDKQPIVKREKPDFSLPRMPELAEFPSVAIFEDDDGYNFMSYKPSQNSQKDTRKKSHKRRHDSKYRTAPSSLQTTIEEESESEITPTPTHAATAIFPTNHVSLDYATGTIGSSKTFSTDSSVFSKTLGTARPDTKSVSSPESPIEDTDGSAEGADSKFENASEAKAEGARDPPKHTSEQPDADTTVTYEGNIKDEQFDTNSEATESETLEKQSSGPQS